MQQSQQPQQQLPPGWSAQWSQQYNCYYYANERTGQTQWTPPSASQPPQPPQQQQQQYQQQYQQQPQSAQPAATAQGSSFQPSGRKKALLVGINYTGSKHALNGCINDANNIKQMLVQQYGYPADQQSMVVLVDDASNPQYRPTTKNMLGAFHWLVGGARPGDQLFFSYSGHGSQIKDPDGDREDGMDDTICPVDFETSGMIDSDMLHKALVTAMPQGCRLTVVMDCCHSGTMMELPYTYQPDANGKMGPKEAIQQGIQVVGKVQRLLSGGFSASKMQDAQSLFGEIKSLASMFSGTGPTTDSSGYKHEQFMEEKSETPKECYLISGCFDNQTSADAQLSGKASGALTYALLQTLQANPQGLSFEGLLAQLRGFMQKQQFTQVPQLSCGVPVDPHGRFLL
ncbi:hypothetical protein HDU98_004979 [Podochytrium sp. JEL0797]|nr:hypothetical protein HDU98_004979 [Podochytrium sp. JEL0797]